MCVSSLAVEDLLCYCLYDKRFTIAVHLVERAIPSDQVSILSAINYTHQCYDSIYTHHHCLSPWQHPEEPEHCALRGNRLTCSASTSRSLGFLGPGMIPKKMMFSF